MKLKKSIWLQTTIVGGILVFLSAFCIGLGGVADWIPDGKTMASASAWRQRLMNMALFGPDKAMESVR